MKIHRVRLAAAAAILIATACMSERASEPTGPLGPSAKTLPPPPPPLTDSIRVTPLSIPAGTPATGTIKMVHPAPSGGLVIPLSTDLPLTITLPANVTAPAGATIVTFPIATHIGFPNSTTTAPVQAFVNGLWIETGANVVTGASTTPPPLGITAPVLSPQTVVGGNTVIGTVKLTGAAPAGGAVVTVQSSNTAVATTPASVTVPAGAQSATFTINTTPVATISQANISLGFAGGFLTTTLTVTPPVTGPLATPSLVSPAADSRFAPGTSITFDWNDVAGAASYELQVDDAATFPAPLILDQSVSASQLSVSTLPTKTMWWRVRAIASSGSAGTWSSARRFEVK